MLCWTLVWFTLQVESDFQGKGTFADLSLYDDTKVQRNYFGSEHGKGEADGETGRFSQAITRARASGQNFRHAADYVEFGKTHYVRFETNIRK